MFNRSHTSVTTVFTSTIAGAAVGAVTALLFAPKKGKQLRKDISNTVTSLPSDVSAMLGKEKKHVRRAITRKRRQISAS